MSFLSTNSPKEPPRLALPFFILLAALFHLSTIYLFRIVYQPSYISKPVPAQVLFLLPNSPISEQIFSWLKSNDPSIFSPLKTIQSSLPAIPSSIYYPKPPPIVLRPLPAVRKNDTTDLLPPTDEAVLPPSFLQITASPVAANIMPVQQTTIIQLLPPLSTRIQGTTLGVPTLPPEVTLPLSPTKLTLNINSEGIPRHVIISQSCGNTTADEAASRWAMSTRFAPADHETWGSLLVIWATSTSEGRSFQKSP